MKTLSFKNKLNFFHYFFSRKFTSLFSGRWFYTEAILLIDLHVFHKVDTTNSFMLTLGDTKLICSLTSKVEIRCGSVGRKKKYYFFNRSFHFHQNQTLMHKLTNWEEVSLCYWVIIPKEWFHAWPVCMKIKKPRNQKIQAISHVENAIDISPSELYEFFIVPILKFNKKGAL